MKRWIALPLLTLALTAQAAAPEGRWTTPWGDMRLQGGDQISGDYDHLGGRVIGQMRGETLEGYWIQRNSEQRCPRDLSGSRYWGRLRLTFDGDRFNGRWGYCDQEPNRDGWSGTRIPAERSASKNEEDLQTILANALAGALPPEAGELIKDLTGGGDDNNSEPATETRSGRPPAVTLEMAMGRLYPDWRSGIENGRPTTLTGDLSCDTAFDYFVGWTDLDNPDRKAYHIAVVYHDGDRLTHHHATLDLGGRGQYAVCVPGPGRFPDITLQGYPLSSADRAAHRLPRSCTGAIKLDDGMCDSIYIGWNPTEKRFILHRN